MRETREQNDTRRLNFLIEEGFLDRLRRLSDDTWTFHDVFVGDSARDAIDHCMGDWPDDWDDPDDEPLAAPAPRAPETETAARAASPETKP